MSSTFSLDPDARLDFTINWTAWLAGHGDPAPDTIEDSEWIVPDGITGDTPTFDDTTATIWLSEGTAGVWYSIVNRVTTAAGRIDDRTISVRVVER